MTTDNGPMKRIVHVMATLWLCGNVLAQNPGAPRDPSLDGLPAKFPAVIDDLSELAAQEEMDLMDWGRVAMLAPQFFMVGPKGVPYTFSRFLNAKTAEEAFLCGVFVVTHGGSVYQLSVRKELETNERKRSWLKQLVGTEKAFYASMEGGEMWKPALQYLPSPAGCRGACFRCMESQDILVRRAGLYWGFWVPNPTYWQVVERWTKSEPDSSTRRMAEYLLNMHRKSAVGS